MHVIFEGVVFRIHDSTLFGINKKWAKIVPLMAKVLCVCVCVCVYVCHGAEGGSKESVAVVTVG